MTLFAFSGGALAGASDAEVRKRPHAVFLIGDREYRSEESMPMLARILKNRHGFDVTLCFSVSDDGVIDPNRPDYFQGIEALADADLMVVFMSWRQPSPEQLGHIMNFLKSGGAVVGFRPTVLTFAENGLNVDFVMDYSPNRSGFGKVYKPNLRPEDIPLVPSTTP